MAANMIKNFTLSLYFLLCVIPFSGRAQELVDPTRPPPGIGDGGQTSGLISYPQVHGLQSVIISPEHCAAIIDGKTVALGAMHGNEKLLEVSERGVVLQGEHGQRTLTLFPTVGMKITVSAKDKQAVKCKAGQKKQIKNPAKPAGSKEMK